jgi:hypothetical protein
MARYYSRVTVKIYKVENLDHWYPPSTMLSYSSYVLALYALGQDFPVRYMNIPDRLD